VGGLLRLFELLRTMTRTSAAAATGALGVDSPETNARFVQSLGLDYPGAE
jgi:hypothetical protein